MVERIGIEGEEEEYHFPIPGQEKTGEKIVLFTRRHLVSFLPSILLILGLVLIPLILIILGFIFSDIFTTAWRILIIVGTSVYFLIIANFAFVEWFSFYYDILIITDKRIIDIVQMGIFNRTITEIALLRVQNVTGIIKGFLPTLFAYGNVRAETAGEMSETLIFEDIPNPYATANKIMELHDLLVLEETKASQLAGGVGVEKPASRHLKPPQPPAVPPQPPPPPPIVPKNNFNNSGEIKKDDLQKGGEVKL